MERRFIRKAESRIQNPESRIKENQKKNGLGFSF
jgi:hypothetical protein